MANSYNVQTLLDGPRNVVVKVDVSLDGVQGDYAIPQMLIQASTLSRPVAGTVTPLRLRVDLLDWDVQDSLAVNLFWDGVGDMPIWRMVGRSMEKAFHIGGLQNNADQPTGNIVFTTTSSAINVPLVATFKVHCVKQY